MRRRLSAAEKAAVRRALVDHRVAPEPVLDAALERAELLVRRPRLREIRGPRSVVAHIALATQAIGITLGVQVYVRRTHVDGEGRVSLALLAHELTHVVQYRRDGTVRFFCRYIAGYLRGRLTGHGHHDAYLAIAYEEEARGVEATIADPRSRVPRTARRGLPGRR